MTEALDGLVPRGSLAPEFTWHPELTSASGFWSFRLSKLLDPRTEWRRAMPSAWRPRSLAAARSLCGLLRASGAPRANCLIDERFIQIIDIGLQTAGCASSICFSAVQTSSPRTSCAFAALPDRNRQTAADEQPPLSGLVAPRRRSPVFASWSLFAGIGGASEYSVTARRVNSLGLAGDRQAGTAITAIAACGSHRRTLCSSAHCAQSFAAGFRPCDGAPGLRRLQRIGRLLLGRGLLVAFERSAQVPGG